MVLAFQPDCTGSNPVQILYFCHAFLYSFVSLLWTLFVGLVPSYKVLEAIIGLQNLAFFHGLILTHELAGLS